jgi:ribosomal protein S18 acetylase RimI-like enzyme
MEGDAPPARPGPRFRAATEHDLPGIVRMLADDMLGSTRERLEEPLPDCYHEAFAAIAADTGSELIVAEVDGVLAGVLQLTVTPGLSHQGARRATIEGVRTDAAFRGRGIGSALVRHAIDRAREQRCRMVQLSSDSRREDARRFYERLGFSATHVGMKLALDVHATLSPGAGV